MPLRAKARATDALKPGPAPTMSADENEGLSTAASVPFREVNNAGTL
jgi:hypothetical protein